MRCNEMLESQRRDSSRLAVAYRIASLSEARVELLPEGAGALRSTALQVPAPSPYLDHELHGLLPLGWHAATDERGAILLQCAPTDADLFCEACNLIERMATGRERPPEGWEAMPPARRTDLLGARLLLELPAAGMVARRVMRRLQELRHDL